MKTVKEMSTITGISIRTLRYYDEIGLLKPTTLTEAGYRLYDNKALAKLLEIMFFRELGIPLTRIKEIMENPDYDRTQLLLLQKVTLEKKRNHLNGMIALIDDMMKGINTMRFETFNNEEIQQMIDHTLKTMSKEDLESQIKQYGSESNYRDYLAKGFINEQATTDILKWYGSKDKALDAILHSEGKAQDSKSIKETQDDIYQSFMIAKAENNTDLAMKSVELLAEHYKKLFQLDNARNILLDLEKEYLNYDKLVKIIDNQYGNGCATFIAKAIKLYYGV